MLMPHRVCIPTILNQVPYCEHERDICHECCQVPSEATARRRFKLPESGQPDYPPSLARSFSDTHLRHLIGRRWLIMQKALFLPPRCLSVTSITLPASASASSPDAPDPLPVGVLQTRLLHLFHQLQVISAARRYFFATHANILLNDYDTFEHAALLYENVLTDVEKCAANLYALDCRNMRSKASIVTTFGYFLGLETQRTFWRIIEMTMEGFMSYLENYDEVLDHQGVMEGKPKACILQCISHVFWSLQHAQYMLDELRRQQHVDFLHKGSFPFYPYRDVRALEGGLDVHVLITKMSTAPVFNFPHFSSLLSAFRQASEFTEQMLDVNVEVMAAIDELTTKFRVMELLISVAAMVSTTEEIKDAMVASRFDRQMEGAIAITEDLKDTGRRAPLLSQNVSLLQGLLIKAAMTRRKHNASFLQHRLLTSESQKLTEDMFQAFKEKYSYLYHGSIRPEFRRLEGSLLPLHAVCRFQQRKEVAKKKKKQQQASVVQLDIAEDRVVPRAANADADFFWEVGNANTSEKYVPPPVRQKIKTRKQGDGADSDMSNEGSQQSTPKSVRDESEKSQEILHVSRPVKESDLKTRDILWRKERGILKWRNFVHFLTHLGCKVMNMDGSIKKVVDMVTGRWALLHRPHPGEDCRPDQRDSYRVHLEDWLHIHYSDVVPDEETSASQSPAADVTC